LLVRELSRTCREPPAEAGTAWLATLSDSPIGTAEKRHSAFAARESNSEHLRMLAEIVIAKSQMR
jgi:hypothetical protein